MGCRLRQNKPLLFAKHAFYRILSLGLRILVEVYSQHATIVRRKYIIMFICVTKQIAGGHQVNDSIIHVVCAFNVQHNPVA